MVYLRNIVFIFSIIVFFSCSSKKNILYLQDYSDLKIPSLNYIDHLIKPGDKVKISLLTNSPEALISFGQNPNYGVESRQSLIFKSYIVSKDGFINYPEIGLVKAESLTIDQLATSITKLLNDKGILVDPVVDVKILNLNFTILGEVNSPGKYYFDDQNLNIFKAIGIAGDLTINGLRQNIKLIRFKDGKQHVHNLDLTKSDFISSEFFQVMSNDIIIVDPNTNKIKSAGIIGNSGTLLSLLSFILSSIIVISN